MTRAKTDTNSRPSTSASKQRKPVDLEVPVRYLHENFEAKDRLAVVLIQKETQRVVQRIATAEKIASPDFQAWLRHMNAGRFEVYVSINTIKPESHGRTKEDIAEVRHVYLDFDENGTAAVQALLKRDDVPEPNYLVNSSAGKWQVSWKVEGFEAAEAERLMRHLARETHADIAATDISRVLRLPGFLNHKYGRPYLVRAESRSTRTYGPEHFPRSPAEEQGTRGVTDKPHQGSSGRITQSERDWAYAKRAIARGEPVDQIVSAIAAFRRGEKCDPVQYAERTVRKAQTSLSSAQRQAPFEVDR